MTVSMPRELDLISFWSKPSVFGRLATDFGRKEVLFGTALISKLSLQKMKLVTLLLFLFLFLFLPPPSGSEVSEALLFDRDARDGGAGGGGGHETPAVQRERFRATSRNCLLNVLDLVHLALHAAVIGLLAAASSQLQTMTTNTLTLQPSVPTQLDRRASVARRNAISKQSATFGCG
jgi:hypothetical protein